MLLGSFYLTLLPRAPKPQPKSQTLAPARRGELLRGCVNLTAADALPQCFPTGDLTLPELCAAAPGGFNLTALPPLLAAGAAADGDAGSLCSPLASPAPDVLGCLRPLACTQSDVPPLGPAGFGFCGTANGVLGVHPTHRSPQVSL